MNLKQRLMNLWREKRSQKALVGKTVQRNNLWFNLRVMKAKMKMTYSEKELTKINQRKF